MRFWTEIRDDFRRFVDEIWRIQTEFWAGAIFVEGAEDITIQHNTLTRLDGNGVFVSGYTRNVNITDSEFSWVPTTRHFYDRKRLPSTFTLLTSYPRHDTF